MKRLTFRGDRTDTIRPGQILGPDAGGLYHEVTAIAYDPVVGRTFVETRKWAPAGQRVRYYGGRGNPQPPKHVDDQPHNEPEEEVPHVKRPKRRERRAAQRSGGVHLRSHDRSP